MRRRLGISKSKGSTWDELYIQDLKHRTEMQEEHVKIINTRFGVDIKIPAYFINSCPDRDDDNAPCSALPW